MIGIYIFEQYKYKKIYNKEKGSNLIIFSFFIEKRLSIRWNDNLYCYIILFQKPNLKVPQYFLVECPSIDGVTFQVRFQIHFHLLQMKLFFLD